MVSFLSGLLPSRGLGHCLLLGLLFAVACFVPMDAQVQGQCRQPVRQAIKATAQVVRGAGGVVRQSTRTVLQVRPVQAAVQVTRAALVAPSQAVRARRLQSAGCIDCNPVEFGVVYGAPYLTYAAPIVENVYFPVEALESTALGQPGPVPVLVSRPVPAGLIQGPAFAFCPGGVCPID